MDYEKLHVRVSYLQLLFDEYVNTKIYIDESKASTIVKAMSYSLMSSGKRVRSLLCILIAEILCVRPKFALSSALALEYIHTYSLIHDDLPSMDNDIFRRNRLSCHVAFSDGQAILAGDGLLSQAFNIIANDHLLSCEQKVSIFTVLGKISSWQGVIGGQSLDLEQSILCQNNNIGIIMNLERIHRLKTGALFRGSAEIGAVLGGVSSELRKIFGFIGEEIGLAFQIRDDILDFASNRSDMGKVVNKDIHFCKVTYPNLLGLNVAKYELCLITNKIIQLLNMLPGTNLLVSLVLSLAERMG